MHSQEGGGERENERTILLKIYIIINEGNGISTVLFLHPALGQNIKQNTHSKSKHHSNYSARERERESQMQSIHIYIYNMHI